jgi:F-type H+-transporting ATPase subunit b
MTRMLRQAGTSMLRQAAIRTLRQAALFGVLGICLAGIAAPRLVWGQESKPAAPEESSESPHAQLYEIINFVILVAGLGYILRKPAAEFFRSRSSSIQKSLDEGRKALEASQAQLQVVEAKLQGLEAEIVAFKASAAREMEAERQRLQKASAAEAEKILESARAQTNVAIRAAKLELKKYAAQKAVTLAEELIRGRLDDSGRERLVTQFVATLETKERKN